MDSALDVIAAVASRAAGSWLGMLLITSPIWLLAAVRGGQALRRRRAFQAFAAAQPQFHFAGTIPSDARLPYSRVDLVRRQVLLSNVVEGQWDGLPVHVFDTARGRTPRWTILLVRVEDMLHRGAEAERVVAAGPAALIETSLDVLTVSPQRPLDTSELIAWLTFATALAKAMERDAKAAFAARG